MSSPESYAGLQCSEEESVRSDAEPFSFEELLDEMEFDGDYTDSYDTYVYCEDVIMKYKNIETFKPQLPGDVVNIFQKMREANEMCDFVIESSDNVKCPVHKAYLVAVNNYFRNMFCGSTKMSESKQNCTCQAGKCIV